MYKCPDNFANPIIYIFLGRLNLPDISESRSLTKVAILSLLMGLSGAFAACQKKSSPPTTDSNGMQTSPSPVPAPSPQPAHEGEKLPTYGSCIPKKGCITGYVSNNMHLTFTPGNNAFGLKTYEFRDAADFGDRFDTAFKADILDKISSIFKLQISATDRLEITYDPIVTTDNFAVGFKIAAQSDQYNYEQVPLPGEANFNLGNVDPTDTNINVRVFKDLSLRMTNRTQGWTSYGCLRFEQKRTGLSLDQESLVLKLGAFRDFKYYFMESSGPCLRNDNTTLDEQSSSGIKRTAQVTSNLNFLSPLDNDEDGENRIVSAQYDFTARELLILKAPLRNLADNTYHSPLLRVRWDPDNLQQAGIESVTRLSDYLPGQILRYGTSFVGSGNFQPWKLGFYATDGAFVNAIQPVMNLDDPNGSQSGTGFYLVSPSSDIFKAIVYRISNATYISQICSVQIINATLVDCKTASQANPPRVAKANHAVKGIGVLGSHYYLMRYDEISDSYEINDFNDRFVFQNDYPFDISSVSQSEMDRGILSSDGKQLIFVVIKNNQISIRTIRLVSAG